MLSFKHTLNCVHRHTHILSVKYTAFSFCNVDDLPSLALFGPHSSPILCSQCGSLVSVSPSVFNCALLYLFTALYLPPSHSVAADPRRSQSSLIFLSSLSFPPPPLSPILSILNRFPFQFIPAAFFSLTLTYLLNGISHLVELFPTLSLLCCWWLIPPPCPGFSGEVCVCVPTLTLARRWTQPNFGSSEMSPPGS